MKILKLILVLISLKSCSTEEAPTPEDVSEDRLYYFGYGSNLLAERMHINNPRAEFYGVAKLENYRLDFNTQTTDWNGADATICEDCESSVWGTVWTIPVADLANLDKQEGVDINEYFARNVTVTTVNSEPIIARTYIQVHNPDKLKPGEVLPLIRQPSKTYIKVIILGAIESKLPLHYIGYLTTNFPNNGKLASKKIREELGFPFLD